MSEQDITELQENLAFNIKKTISKINSIAGKGCGCQDLENLDKNSINLQLLKNDVFTMRALSILLDKPA